MTIMDSTGHTYLDPQNPLVGALSRRRAREEEYREEIDKTLGWVNGAQVAVQLVPAPEAASPPSTVREPDPSPPPPPTPPVEELRLPAPPSMSMNRPLDSTTDETRNEPNLSLDPGPAPAAKVHADPRAGARRRRGRHVEVARPGPGHGPPELLPEPDRRPRAVAGGDPDVRDADRDEHQDGRVDGRAPRPARRGECHHDPRRRPSDESPPRRSTPTSGGRSRGGSRRGSPAVPRSRRWCSAFGS